MPACSLISREDVTRATGRDPYVDPEPAGQGGWICNVGSGELKVYSGLKSWEAWEPRTPAPGFGERAYFLFLKGENEYQANVGFLVAQSGNHTVALSLDAPKGAPGASMRTALESLMRTILSRLR